MKGVWLVLKIHIVQKGDTLWDLSKKYGVDFEELKQANPQLSSPDMVMPGMKIKIPSTTKAVKKETKTPAKETPKKETQHPYQELTPKPMPVIKEDDHAKKMIPKPEMPVQPMQPMPVQPMMEQELQNYTMINFPQMPQYHEEAKEKPKKEQVKAEAQPKPKKEHVKAEAQPTPQPQFQPMPLPMPEPHAQPMPQQGPMLPLCCHIVHPCYPPVPFPLMVNPEGFHPSHQLQQGMPLGQMPVHAPPQNMDLAINPMYAPGNNDCGCNGNASGPQFDMPRYENGNNYKAFNQPMSHALQGGMTPSNMYPPQFPPNENKYPDPPEYPNFSNVQNQEADETTGE